MMNLDTKSLLMMAGAILLGAIAHVAKYFNDNPEVAIRVVVVLSSIAISCFAGVVFGLLVSVYTDEMTWILISSSVGAYMGDKGIETVWDKVLELITRK